MENVKIKVIKRKILKDLLDSYIRAFKEDPWNDLWERDKAYQRLESYIDSPKFYGIYIEVDSKAIGALLGNIKIQSDGYVYYLEEFFVHPDYQGLGYGKSLYNKMIEDMRNKGLIGVVYTTINNSQAYRMYISQGAYEMYDHVNLGHQL